MKPTIISNIDTGGFHNADLRQTVKRLKKSASYKDLSHIIIIPAFKTIETRVVSSWLSMFGPPNQKSARFFAQGMEVGDAYSKCIESILDNPDLSKFRFIITIEHDNTPPPDGLVRLLATADAHPEFAVIGGLYFTKGHGGVAQIWGDPNDHPINFRPQLPDTNGGLKECNGTGMGFTCFRLDMFKDKKLRRPWFKTVASTSEGVGTQDLYFAGDARRHGYRFAIDCSIKVGHWDASGDSGNGIMW